MTSIGAAIAVDARGPSALYIITDSRITWLQNSGRWDAGQKAFISNFTPDIFAYMGNAFLPPSILRQVCDQINCGLLFAPTEDAETRHMKFKERVQASLLHYKRSVDTNFSIFHGARDGEYMASRFRLWELRYYSATKRWEDRERPIVIWESCLVHITGSGREYITKRVEDWEKSKFRGTTRAAIWAFCDALSSESDPATGGAPQLVGIWRKGLPQHFGFIWKGVRYLAGVEVPAQSPDNSVKWFNELFERCDGVTGKRLKDAKKHQKSMG